MNRPPEKPPVGLGDHFRVEPFHAFQLFMDNSIHPVQDDAKVQGTGLTIRAMSVEILKYATELAKRLGADEKEIRQMTPTIPFSILIFALSAPGFASECVPTPHRTTGTHYKPVTSQQIDVGNGVMVSGQVLAAPDCKPVANARVAHWQASEDGRYIDRLRAYLFTDSQGRYQFETEWPDINPPHIHFIVTAEGHNKLETQWVGEDPQDDILFTMVLERKD